MPKKTKDIVEDALKSTLYGIIKSNRSAKDLWGKNQFNSSFPASLACWMRDNNISPVYIKTVKKNKEIKVETNELLTWDDIFKTKKANNELTFCFEYPYKPYEKYIHTDAERLDNIDLVIADCSDKDNPVYLRPLEVKLTVLPDNTTFKLKEEEWCSELVVRPASTSYAALGIFNNIPDKEKERVREIIEPISIKVRDWSAHSAILQNKDGIIRAIDIFYEEFLKYQQPFLMQPIWKTVGMSPEFAEQAFDIFVWSDYSLCRTFIDTAKSENEKTEKVSRSMRSCARLLRCLYELTTTKKVLINRIYREMALDNQTDKEFALSGKKTISYMACSRLLRPKLSKNVLASIILNGGENKLSPERRFDASIFFTAKQLFEEKK